MGTKGCMQTYAHMHLCTPRSAHMIMHTYIYAHIKSHDHSHTVSWWGTYFPYREPSRSAVTWWIMEPMIKVTHMIIMHVLFA